MAGEELTIEEELKLQKVKSFELPYDMSISMLEMGSDDADEDR